MKIGLILAGLLIFTCVPTFSVTVGAAELLEATPRTAIISGYQPEWAELQRIRLAA
jgi:hypothetical protein